MGHTEVAVVGAGQGTDLKTLTVELEQDRSLDEPARVRERIDALDRLEAHLLHERDGGDAGAHSLAGGLHERARALYARLDAVEREVYRTIRREIQQGARPDWLLQWAAGSGHERQPSRGVDEGYDYLDVLASGVLRFEEPRAPSAVLTGEMVAYQPTPARHVLDLLRRAALTGQDVLVDLGSGLGHVPLLAAMCTGAESIGVELEPAYVESARQAARALNLAGVTFIQQDAREADCSRGTLFYLYTPFRGTILRAVLDALRGEAASRQIRIGTYGPCTAAIAQEPWLEAVGKPETGRIALFRSRL